jgi:hypothetical protein
LNAAVSSTRPDGYDSRSRAARYVWLNAYGSVFLGEHAVVERTRLDAELNALADDVVLEAQAVLVARDEETGRSRPLLEEERAAFERATA